MRIIKGFVSMAHPFGRPFNTMNQLCLKGGNYRKIFLPQIKADEGKSEMDADKNVEFTCPVLRYLGNTGHAYPREAGHGSA